MMVSAFALLSVSLLQVDVAAPEKGSSAATMVKAFSEEDELLKNGHATKLFAAILEQGLQPARPGTGSAQAIELLENADKVVKTILRNWLEQPRPLDSRPPTMQAWRDFRSKVVGHGEAIVLEAVLTPEQARRWRKQADPALMPPMRGRYSIIPVDDSDGHDLRNFTRGGYYSIIYSAPLLGSNFPLLSAIGSLSHKISFAVGITAVCMTDFQVSQAYPKKKVVPSSGRMR